MAVETAIAFKAAAHPQVASPPPAHDLERPRLTGTSARVSDLAGGEPSTASVPAAIRPINMSQQQGATPEVGAPQDGSAAAETQSPEGMQNGVQHFDADSKSVTGGSTTFSILAQAAAPGGLHRPYAQSGVASHLFGQAFHSGGQLQQPQYSMSGLASGGLPSQSQYTVDNGLNASAMHSGGLRHATQPLPQPGGHVSGAHSLFGDSSSQQQNQGGALEGPFSGASNPLQQQAQLRAATGSFGSTAAQFGMPSGAASQFGAVTGNQFSNTDVGTSTQFGDATANLNMGLQSLSQAGNFAALQGPSAGMGTGSGGLTAQQLGAATSAALEQQQRFGNSGGGSGPTYAAAASITGFADAKPSAIGGDQGGFPSGVPFVGSQAAASFGQLGCSGGQPGFTAAQGGFPSGASFGSQATAFGLPAGDAMGATGTLSGGSAAPAFAGFGVGGSAPGFGTQPGFSSQTGFASQTGFGSQGTFGSQPGALVHSYSQASGLAMSGGVQQPSSSLAGWRGAHLGPFDRGPAGEQVEALLAEAHQAYRRGDFAQALHLCHAIFPTCMNRTDVLLLVGAVYYQLGNYQQCIAFNDRCILLDPHMAEAHANLANALQQIGNFDLALIYYQSALTLKPGFTDAYNNMASALVQKGCIPQAMDCYAAALRIDPNVVDVHNNLGDLWRAQGAAGRVHAQRCYAEALRCSPQHAPAWRGLGDLYREFGDHPQAVACYQEAVRLRAGYADAYTGMGVSLKELRRHDEAAVCFRAVVQLRPGCALSLGNLAGLYYEQGKLEDAVATYREAIAREPIFPEAYNNLGNALRESGRADEAVACYTACIQLQLQRPATAAGTAAARPNLANPGAAPAAQAQRLSVAYNNLGGILKMQGRAAEAISCYEQVALLQPTSPEGHANLASAFKDAARQDSAIASYRRALALRPDFPEAFANLVHSLQCVCEWRDRAAMFVRLEGEVRRDLAAGRLPPVQPFHIMAYPFPADLAKAVSMKYAEFCALTAARLNAPPFLHPPAMAVRPGQRLRVAYVSSDFGNHPLSHLMASVFGSHDRSRLEVFCYALSPPDGSEWRSRIEQEVEHFTDVSSWTVPDIAARISADQIQVAVNLNGYTKGARNEIFALRPAPVQTSYMGFPATTGADFLPYLITDKVVAPPECRDCYSESLALMPHCYFVNDYKQAHLDVLDESRLPTRASVGLPEGVIVYACSNQLYKYDPDTFQTWCNILRRVPNSILWLLRFPPYGEPHVKAEAAARGIDPSRIIFTDVAAKPVHIARSGLADVFLDTPLCNAHTTGCDVLWGGCPMVTLPLQRMASRVAASLCAATGLGTEMIVNSQQEYEEVAVALGTDHARRLDLRRRLKDTRLTCPLFDTSGWVRDLEKVYFRMWDIHCAGQLPHTFEV
mmetsp:Transcript_2181/g.6511  ORF Transcript_2181/g.6511 Transcript_2181/m.6511 type:complete len:1397 (+) Transcript_2181:421-4611(+)